MVAKIEGMSREDADVLDSGLRFRKNTAHRTSIEDEPIEHDELEQTQHACRTTTGQEPPRRSNCAGRGGIRTVRERVPRLHEPAEPPAKRAGGRSGGEAGDDESQQELRSHVETGKRDYRKGGGGAERPKQGREKGGAVHEERKPSAESEEERPGADVWKRPCVDDLAPLASA